MKLQELYTKRDKADRHNETHPDGPHRYFIKHVENDDKQSGHYEIIDMKDRTPVNVFQYNSTLEAEEKFKEVFKAMTKMNMEDNINEAEKTDMSELPPELIKDLEKNIRKGASDLKQKWSNALELVHKAYDVGYQDESIDADGKKVKLSKPIQRPTPQMAGGWKQYEELIKYAVEQLSKSRGLKADWRASSSKVNN